MRTLKIRGLAIEQPISRLKEAAYLFNLNRHFPWIFCLVCLWILFANLGSAALFEPDEGRNAEKAREILLLKDWVTPHENFLPVLDKPIFFYWLIAFAYKLFGISEWSARLPSALAALGCLILTYRFVRRNWGQWEALWSALILVTNIQFYLLSRIVILDMTLTFLISLALFSFYAALHTEAPRLRRFHCLLMYAALGAGTLVKGLIGIVIPGTVFFFYLMLTHQWRALGRLHLFSGALIYLAIVVPWYLWVDARNPGFLRYYFWHEHFSRYVSDEFDRSKSWYYFFSVLAVGFLPWSLVLPFAPKILKNVLVDKNLFVVLWAALPFTFFSLGNSQMPHYILPIFPALAMLTGQTVAGIFSQPDSRWRGIVYLPWAMSAGFVLYLAAGSLWPDLLVREILASVDENRVLVWLVAFALLIGYGGYGFATTEGHFKEPWASFQFSVLGLALFMFLVGELKETGSLQRSAKTVAQAAVPLISPTSQLVLYNTYMTGLPFYLRLDRPIWVVTPKGKTTLMSSPYVSRHLPEPAPGYGKVLFSDEEFNAFWNRDDKEFRVFLKKKNLSRFQNQLAAATEELVEVDDYVMVTKR